MQGIRVRPATPSDVDAVAAFQLACWREAYRGIVPDAFLDGMDPVARTANWRRRIEQREREVLVALDGSEVVGVVSWTPDAVDELNTLYVARRARGTGLADRLLAGAVAARPAALWVFSTNTRARRFYARHGFVAVGEPRIDAETGVEELRLSRPGSSSPH